MSVFDLRELQSMPFIYIFLDKDVTHISGRHVFKSCRIWKGFMGGEN